LQSTGRRQREQGHLGAGSALASLLDLSYSEEISSRRADRLREKAAEARAEYDSMRSELRRLRAYERAWTLELRVFQFGKDVCNGRERILAEELAREEET
jgi:hypothetical protein